jgi:predicted nucleotidyltransferase component of viral defense system
MVSFHENVIPESCLRAFEFLQRYTFLKDYYLAGGTALALQIGHRVSTDLDWFSATNRLGQDERDRIRAELADEETFSVASEQEGMLFARVFETDISFIYQQHPLLEKTVNYRGFNLASPLDIGLMKLAAINSRGTRRDFVDLYCMRDITSLDKLFDLATKKYANRPSFLAITARALVYFEDAETQPMPQMHIEVVWEDVRAYCENAARNLSRDLSGLS